MDITQEMNICFFTSEVPNLLTGGIENVTYRLAEGFRNRGHKVYCLSLDKRFENTMDLPFIHHCIGKEGPAENDVKDFLLHNNIEIVINQAVEQRWKIIISNIKKDLPNVAFLKVLHSDPYYIIKGVIDREPLYTESNDIARLFYKINPTTIIRRIRRQKYSRSLYRDWLSLYDRIILLSDTLINDFYRIAGATLCEKVLAISNPVKFSSLNINVQKEKIVLYVGRINKNAKRPDRLIAIWEQIYKKFPDWKLIFIGDGPLRKSLENYCDKKQLANVSFVGQTDPTPYYRKASILCVTSTYEGFPTVCGEALANRVIPIAFNSFGAVPDLITDNHTGLLVKPFSLNEYAKKLATAMSEQSFADKMRQNILKDTDFKTRYDMESVIEKWESLFITLKRK